MYLVECIKFGTKAPFAFKTSREEGSRASFHQEVMGSLIIFLALSSHPNAIVNIFRSTRRNQRRGSIDLVYLRKTAQNIHRLLPFPSKLKIEQRSLVTSCLQNTTLFSILARL